MFHGSRTISASRLIFVWSALVWKRKWVAFYSIAGTSFSGSVVLLLVCTLVNCTIANRTPIYIDFVQYTQFFLRQWIYKCVLLSYNKWRFIIISVHFILFVNKNKHLLFVRVSVASSVMITTWKIIQMEFFHRSTKNQWKAYCHESSSRP